MTYYLAIDIGASSGRHILGSVKDGKIQIEEIYRFENNLEKHGDSLCWNIENLFTEVKNGLKKCSEIGKIPKTVAVDTWGVDYVLLDENKNEILPVFSYRDSRTSNVLSEKDFPLSQNDIYSRTGIQYQPFNTVFQLWCDKKSGKLSKAKHFLMMPEYLSFKLTGKIANEYSNATTGALVNAQSKQFDEELLDALGYPKEIFSSLSLPTAVVGNFKNEIKEEVGFDSTVVFCPSHDTASAVAACPIDDETVYISSGTWSLIGTENSGPILTEEAQKANFTNEGGIEYRFRFLKNIMGMWLFQNIRKNLNKKYTYDEMMNMAKGSDYTRTFDPNSSALVAPENMIEAIRSELKCEKLPIEDVLKSTYLSLAESYDKAVREIEKICNKDIKNIFIVGGGSKDKYLNLLTAQYTGKKVYTGLTEATATGNILSQIMHDKNIDLTEARKIIRTTFAIKEADK